MTSEGSEALAARTLVLAAVAAVVLAGCGKDPASRAPAAVVRDYLAAERAADGKRICTLYSDRYRDAAVNDPDNEPRRSCAQLAALYARRYRDEGHRLKSVTVDGFRAVATVTCADPTTADCSLPLVSQDGVWRIDGSLSPND